MNAIDLLILRSKHGRRILYMTKLLECDVAVMGSGVAGMGAAYKLANAGGLKIA